MIVCERDWYYRQVNEYSSSLEKLNRTVRAPLVQVKEKVKSDLTEGVGRLRGEGWWWGGGGGQGFEEK